MRKAMAILAVVLLSILLAACTDEAATEEREATIERFDTTSIKVYEDSDTGCKYLIYNTASGGGVTALLKADGTPDCGN